MKYESEECIMYISRVVKLQPRNFVWTTEIFETFEEAPFE